MNSFRLGIGEDIHPLVTGRPLILGGVHIQYEKGLSGVSDADVVLHALSDALLGSLALGDLGLYFPPDDPRCQGIDSALIVAEALKLVRSKGYRIGNVDISIAAEAPHLAPFILAMRQNIAEILGTKIENVSVKAMSNEGFDAVGRGEAIKATAAVLVYEKTLD